MKIHYFQRYHSKENVATANTMLLLSRFYSYSSEKFFAFLKSEFFEDAFEPELTFNLQEKSTRSVPDATITQESFKVVVETKTSDWFYSEQLINHLESFSDEKYKVLITLAPVPMEAEKKADFDTQLKEYNESQKYRILHKNTTFKALADAIAEYIDDRDFEMQAIMEDYLDYCYRDHLISVSDAWKQMIVQLAGTTIDFNMENSVYYGKADRAFKEHDYIGLYKGKSVRAIGKVCARIVAAETENGIEYEKDFGEITEERKAVIRKAIEDSEKYGYNLRDIKHRYFFVEKFCETDFRKITPRAPMGYRSFDLTQVLETENLPDVETMAELLKEKTWN